MSTYSKKLKQMNATVQDLASSYSGDPFALLPDGDYNFRVSASIAETQKTGELRVGWQFTVDEGDLQGRSVYDGNMLNNQMAINILRYRLEKLGYDWPEDISELEGILENLTASNPLISATCKMIEKDGYTNPRITFLEVLESGESAEEAAYCHAKAEAAGTDGNLDRLKALCVANSIDGLADVETIEDAVTAITDAEMTADDFPEQDVDDSDFLREIGLEVIAKEVPAPTTHVSKEAILVKKAAPVLKKRK